MSLIQGSKKKFNWKKEWIGMPEFDDSEKIYHRTIKVSFETKDDYEKFAKLINQNLTEKTKSIWFPKVEESPTKIFRYIDEDEL